MREIFTFNWVLTSDAFRLNNRDNLRERPSGDSDDSSIAFQLESIRKSEMSFKPKTRPTAVAVTMNNTANADSAAGPGAYDDKHGSDKSVRILLVVVALRD